MENERFVYKGGGIFIYDEDAHQPALTSVGGNLQILDITDAVGRSLLERIPDRHLAQLDEDERRYSASLTPGAPTALCGATRKPHASSGTRRLSPESKNPAKPMA